MTLYAEVGTTIRVYESSAKQNCKSSLYIGDQAIDAATDLIYETSSRIKLVGGAANVAVNFQSVTDGRLITLKSNDEFKVRVNDVAGTLITLTPRTSTGSVVTPAFLALLGRGITSLYLTNPSATAVIEVDVGIAGA